MSTVVPTAPHLKTSLPGPKATAIIERDRAVVSPSYTRDYPLVIARGEGEAEKWLHSFYFGNGQVGLRDLVSEDNVARIDVREITTTSGRHDNAEMMSSTRPSLK